MVKYYTGVGSRKTPESIKNIMTRLAKKLAADGWILRSGGAEGADKAFEAGAGSAKEIFYAADATAAAMLEAARFHPAWDRCSPYAQRLHGRNALQVLGRNLDSPSTFLVCWTPDGCTTHAWRTIETGGTGTAISIADYHEVEVLNLARPEHLERAIKYLAKE